MFLFVTRDIMCGIVQGVGFHGSGGGITAIDFPVPENAGHREEGKEKGQQASYGEQKRK